MTFKSSLREILLVTGASQATCRSQAQPLAFCKGAKLSSTKDSPELETPCVSQSQPLASNRGGKYSSAKDSLVVETPVYMQGVLVVCDWGISNTKVGHKTDNKFDLMTEL